MSGTPCFSGGGQVHGIWLPTCGSLRPSPMDPAPWQLHAVGTLQPNLWLSACAVQASVPELAKQSLVYAYAVLKLSGCKSFCLRLSHTVCGKSWFPMKSRGLLLLQACEEMVKQFDREDC